MRLGDLVVRFVADMGQWKTGVKEAQGDMDKTAKAAGDMGKAAKTSAADLGLLFAATAAAAVASRSLAMEYGGMAQQLRDLSLQTDISIDKLQKLKYAALISGTDFGKVTFGLNNITLAMDAAKDPNSEQAKAFSSLGINPSGKSPDQVFEDIALALSKVKDQSTRNALANSLLGKSWKEMIPYMDTYLKRGEEIQKHPVFNEKDFAAFERAKTGWDEIGDAMYNVGGKGVSMALRIQEAVNKLNPASGPLQGALSGIYSWIMGPQDPEKTAPGVQADPNTGVYAEIQKRVAALKEAFGWEEKIVSSRKEYLAVAKEIDDIQKAKDELRSDFISDVQNAGGDVASARSLTMGYNRSMGKLQRQENDLGGDLQSSAFKAIAASRMDTETYNALSLNIENVNLSKDYPLNAFISDYERVQATKRKQQGVRTAT